MVGLEVQAPEGAYLEAGAAMVPTAWEVWAEAVVGCKEETSEEEWAAAKTECAMVVEEWAVAITKVMAWAMVTAEVAVAKMVSAAEEAVRR